MSETKFTPGPWEICKDGACPCKQIWSIPGDFPVATGNGVHIGAVHQHMADAPDLIYASLSDETRKANAALIAAAPDLYAALSDLMENEKFHTMVGGNPNVVEELLSRCYAALAKARGET